MTRGARGIAVVLVLAALGAACSRSDDDPSGAPGASGTSAPTSSTTIGDEAALDAGGFGSIAGLCGAGDAEPVTDQPGIDGTTISVGTFSDRGFAGRPGLNQELFDTATAVVDWCNEQGGVRGYTLDSDLHDAALTNVVPEMAKGCEQDFFLVGGGTVLDDTGQKTRLECALPDLTAFSVTGEAAHADLSLTSLSNPAGKSAVPELVYAQKRWPDLVKKAAVITVATPSTELVSDQYLEAFDELGWKAAYTASLAPLGEASYAPFVQAMKEKGVEVVVYIGEPQVLAALQKAGLEKDWKPTAWLPSTNAYDRTYIPEAANAVNGTYTRSIFWPLEDAEHNKATADYLQLLKQSKGRVALLGMQGMSMWTLFLQSLGSCADAGTVTRDCVWDEASKATDWTAGGMHAAVDATQASPQECFLMLEATPSGWVRAPEQNLDADGYECDPHFVVPLRGDYGEGARCPSGVEAPKPSTCA